MGWLDESTIKATSDCLRPSVHLFVHPFIHSLGHSATDSFSSYLLSAREVQALSLGVISLWLFSRSSVELELPRPCLAVVLCVACGYSQAGVDSPSLRKTHTDFRLCAGVPWLLPCKYLSPGARSVQEYKL